MALLETVQLLGVLGICSAPLGWPKGLREHAWSSRLRGNPEPRSPPSGKPVQAPRIVGSLTAPNNLENLRHDCCFPAGSQPADTTVRLRRLSRLHSQEPPGDSGTHHTQVEPGKNEGTFLLLCHGMRGKGSIRRDCLHRYGRSPPSLSEDQHHGTGQGLGHRGQEERQGLVSREASLCLAPGRDSMSIF